MITDDAWKGVVPLGHSAIVAYNYYTVESNSPGVQYLNDQWRYGKKQVYGVTVASTTIKQDIAAADWAFRQLNKPYNYDFYNTDTRSKFYCSQLVWAAFKDTAGVDLNTNAYDMYTNFIPPYTYTIGFGLVKVARAIHPMELVNNSKVILIYRKK